MKMVYKFVLKIYMFQCDRDLFSIVILHLIFDVHARSLVLKKKMIETVHCLLILPLVVHVQRNDWLNLASSYRGTIYVARSGLPSKM